jgi:hypothetical protein
VPDEIARTRLQRGCQPSARRQSRYKMA